MILIIGGANQGKTQFAIDNFGDNYKIENHYYLKVKEQLINDTDPIKAAESLGEKDNLIIITNEIGCGLVPVDAFERKYRETNGRVNCFLAEKAEQVIRVFCGIGTKIK